MRCVQDGTDAPALDAPAPDVPGLDAPSFDTPTDLGALDVPMALDVPLDASLPICDVAALCDDFESDVPSRVPPWTYVAGAPPRSTVRASGGAASGAFTTPGGVDPPYHFLGLDVDPSTTEVWVRLWAYFPSDPAFTDGAIVVLGGAMGGNVSLIAGGNEYGIYSTVAGRFVGSRPHGVDVWQCVTYHVEIGTTGTVEARIEGGTPISDTAIDTALPGGLGLVGVGLTYVGPGQATTGEVDLDDVTITLDGTPLACP